MTISNRLKLGDALHRWLKQASDASASDIHLITGYPPTLRVHGTLQVVSEPPLDDGLLQSELESINHLGLLDKVKTNKNFDFAFEAMVDGSLRRFRVNVFWHGGKLGACLRLIPHFIPNLAWAQFPQELANRLTQLHNGLVLITGVAGAGKSTTLAMLVQRMNEAGNSRIITVEDPVEYKYPSSNGSLITQREVGSDVESFADGLKYGLRQDPDVILVGEIRDIDTARMALSAAETGHLVLSTLHTSDAKGAISRFTDLFPTPSQSEIRSQLAISLKAVIGQRLLPSSIAGEKRELALEVMLRTSPIASSIRQGKLESIDNYMMTSRAEGMITMDESIKRLLFAGKITRETAEQFVSDPGLLVR